MGAALTINRIGVSFGGFKAVDGVSIAIEDGELRVLLGANGAGKTTLMDLISGKIRSTEGQILVGDVDVTHWEEQRIARAGVGRKFQIPAVFRELSVRRNLEVASCRGGVFANFGFGFGRKSAARVDEALELVGLARQSDRIAGSLSHGETQWLELGLLIVQNPRVLLLDEPTAGMTQGETGKTAEIIKRLRGRHTVVVVEHDMGFVREIAGKITVMHLGKVLAEGDIAAIEKNPQVREAYLGSKGISAC